MLHYITSGESHGPQLTAIIAGFPSGIPVKSKDIDEQLRRRQKGYGRGGRMKIEKDRVEIVSGVRFGYSMGSPVTLVIRNRDYENWMDFMGAEPKKPDSSRNVTRPRPGHADLVGCLKYAHSDARNILERASARETAARVAVGAVARCLLHQFDIDVFSHVVSIGEVKADISGMSYSEIKEKTEKSDVRCASGESAAEMRSAIDAARGKGDTLGGVVELVAVNLPAGLGDVMNWEGKLDARIAMALMSIQSAKGVEIGMGFKAAETFGSGVHDAIHYEDENSNFPEGHGPSGGFYHDTNNAGGIEGGMTNGEPVVCRVAFKPIPTMMTPKRSVDLKSKETFDACKERSDVCAVPAAGVVAEAALAYVLANAFLEKFGGDSLLEIRRNYEEYVKFMQNY